MDAYQIMRFRQKLLTDPENLELRRNFHEGYEWLEAYWNGNYSTNMLTKFSQDFGDFYFGIEKFKNLTRILAGQDPVGNSNRNFEPTLPILRATSFLRFRSGLFTGDMEFLDIDDIEKYSEEWKTNSLHAVLTIISQIRNNLFHGKKMEIQEDQYSRNKELVLIGAKITLFILDKLEEAESSLTNAN